MNLKCKFLQLWLPLVVAMGLTSCGTTKKIKSFKTATSDSVAYSTHASGYDSTASATAVMTMASAIDSNVATLASTTFTRRVTFQLDTSVLRPVNDYEAAELRPVSFSLDGREYKSSLPVMSVTVEDIEETVTESKSAVKRSDTAYAATGSNVHVAKSDTASAVVTVSKKETTKAKEIKRSMPWYLWLLCGLYAIALAIRLKQKAYKI